jgi:hypothetical protein
MSDPAKCDHCDTDLVRERCPDCVAAGIIDEAAGRRPLSSGAPDWLLRLAQSVGAERPVHWTLVRKLLVEFVRLWLQSGPSHGRVAGTTRRSS